MGDCYAHLRPTSEERLFAARVEDLAQVACERGIMRFSNFLDLRQQELARCAVSAWDCGQDFFGGYPGAERVMLGCAPGATPPQEDFPLAAVTIRFRVGEGISHRDVLGALMGLKLKREAVGDILVGGDLAVVFVLERLVWPILQELDKVGAAGVRCEAGLPEQLPLARRVEELGGVVSSLRLDCVAAFLCNVSREQAQRLVRAGQVQINAQVTDAVAHELSEGDMLSIRGQGRFRLSQVGGRTKKDRLHITIEKYI